MPVPRAELTWAHRRILKLYYDLCPKPDDTELTLLASLTERSPAETKQWFDEKIRQEEAAARRAERERQQQALLAKQRAEGGNGPNMMTPEMLASQDLLWT